MTIDPSRYRKNKGKKPAPIMVNIRLRRVGAASKPTAEDVRDALQFMLTNEEVPDGWQLAVINWKHPRAASDHWRTGKLQAFSDLAAVIQSALSNARISIVRKGQGEGTT